MALRSVKAILDEVIDGIETSEIAALAVTAEKIAANAVTTAKILDANVTAGKLAANAVETAKILDANVTAGKLAANAVETAKILDANVTDAKLSAVTQLKLAALSGDMVLAIAPPTATKAATAAAWTRTVTITLKNAAGATHTWFNGQVGVSIGDTSVAGTASIPAATATFVSGVASVVVSGDAAAWLENDTDTLTVAALAICGYSIAGGTSVQTIIAA